MSFDDQDNQEKSNFEGSKFREEVFSKAVRAGKRTYFFDVKATRKNELYLTITESKKKSDSGGNQFFEKHKIFLYKEDFDKFVDGLAEIIEFIKEKQPLTEDFDESDEEFSEYSNIEFEDLSVVKTH
jgi:hypothetical protein